MNYIEVVNRVKGKKDRRGGKLKRKMLIHRINHWSPSLTKEPLQEHGKKRISELMVVRKEEEKDYEGNLERPILEF